MTKTQRLDVRELINANPLSRFQKLVVFLGFCVIALDGFDIAIMGFIAPTLKQEWGVSNHELGFVISAALIGLALGAIFSGPLADWLGRKKSSSIASSSSASGPLPPPFRKTSNRWCFFVF